MDAYHLIPLIALLSWPPVAILLFYRLPVRVAILANFFAGWAVLPGAVYNATPAEFPYWILGVCLPTDYILTKALVIGLGALLGAALFQWRALAKFRPSIYDLPMGLWCAVPILSALFRGGAWQQALLAALYLSLAWGVPWVLGRIFFAEYDAMLLAAKASVIAGFCYIPICLTEMATGPIFYASLYGYQPYRWVGAARYVGFRPIGFLEDGNQLGIWIATASLLGLSLALTRNAERILGLPARWIAIGLAAVTLLCQSVGSIVLLLLFLPVILIKRRKVLSIALGLVITTVVGLAVLRLTTPISLVAAARSNPVVHSFASALERVGRHSFAWRLARDEGDRSLSQQSPILGSGQWDWWKSGKQRPWGLWMLVQGMYGYIGLAALWSILLLPVFHALRSIHAGQPPQHAQLVLAVIGVVLIITVDAFLNGDLLLPYVLFLGGLISIRHAAAQPSIA